jgi:hypothetical protein
MMNTSISNKTAAFNGALVAVAGVFAYSLVVMLYVIIRSSVNIYSIMPSSERSTILCTNGFSMAYSVAVFSLLMAVPSSVAGAVAGVILRKMLWWFNPQLHFNKAILVSSITALVLLAALYLLLYVLLKERITFQYVPTFLFWYVFPAVIFFTVCVVGGIRLNRTLLFTRKKAPLLSF